MVHFKALIKDYNFHSCITACDYEDLRFEFNKQIIDKKIIKTHTNMLTLWTKNRTSLLQEYNFITCWAEIYF